MSERNVLKGDFIKTETKLLSSLKNISNLRRMFLKVRLRYLSKDEVARNEIGNFKR